MNSAALAVVVLTIFVGGTTSAGASPGTGAVNPPDSGADADVAPGKDGAEAKVSTRDIADLCFFAGTPPANVKYTTIKKLKAGKGTYGGVKDILPTLAAHARKVGADAIIEFEGSQRFGVFPWRIVRPVVRGVAVKWSDGKSRDCAAMGGTTLQTILATDQPPPQ